MSGLIWRSTLKVAIGGIELSDDTESRVAEACRDVIQIMGEIGPAGTVDVIMYDSIAKIG